MVEKRNSLIVILLLLCISVFCQLSFDRNTANKVVIDGNTYYLYKVKKSEGLYRIGKNFSVSQKEILDVNPEAKNGVVVGQLLKIPVIKGRNSDQNEISISDDFRYHTVENGQTLYFIARKYNTPIDSLVKYNIGIDKLLLEGSIVKITNHNKSKVSVQEGNYSLHKVSSKETLYGLSKKYKCSPKDIIELNPAVKNGNLIVGKFIKVPNKKEVKQKQKEPVADEVMLQDTQFVYYKIEVGETLYSISKKFNCSLGDIERVNSSIDVDDMPIGYLLRIPKKQVKSQSILESNKDFIIHVVSKKETLFSISRTYGINLGMLKRYNSPEVINNLKKGDSIRIPTNSFLQRRANEIFSSIDSTENINNKSFLDTIDCANVDQNRLINVALLLPFAIEESVNANVYKEKVGDEIVEKARENKVLAPKSKVFIDYYQGVLLALDQIKEEGAKINLFVYDTKGPDSIVVNNLISSGKLSNMDLIMGPGYASNLNTLSVFARDNNIQLVYPLSSKGDEVVNNSSIIQVNSSDTLINRDIASFIALQSEHARILVIQSKNPSVNEMLLTNDIREAIYLKYLPLGISPNYKEYIYSKSDIRGLEQMIEGHEKCIVIIPSDQESDVTGVVTALHGVVMKLKADVSLIGLPDWLRYQTFNPDEVHELDTYIFSHYGIDYCAANTQSFITKFRERYRTEPFALSPYFHHSSTSSNYSRYGILGYDITYYFIGALKKYGKDFAFCLNRYETDLIQSNFSFERINNWGGMYNRGMFLLHFNSAYNVDRLKFSPSFVIK